LDGLKGFDWDLANVEHLLRHSVTPFEVEEAVTRPHAIIPAATVKREKRWKLLGRTDVGRYLGGGVHHPPETLPGGDRLRDER